MTLACWNYWRGTMQWHAMTSILSRITKPEPCPNGFLRDKPDEWPHAKNAVFPSHCGHIEETHGDPRPVGPSSSIQPWFVYVSRYWCLMELLGLIEPDSEITRKSNILYAVVKCWCSKHSKSLAHFHLQTCANKSPDKSSNMIHDLISGPWTPVIQP